VGRPNSKIHFFLEFSVHVSIFIFFVEIRVRSINNFFSVATYLAYIIGYRQKTRPFHFTGIERGNLNISISQPLYFKFSHQNLVNFKIFDINEIFLP
jgi:hypothetical protein